eukprot:TRINITY_DN23369_c0_g1_i1.p2 TRINITY_DN23369_c0_g1~~TRINITY_DN23369_c0_g1_i1.p2  ORF type:complete len:151 (+),score=22.45 TRINITY_DN23369_c0_g1_i1:46-453(+)
MQPGYSPLQPNEEYAITDKNGNVVVLTEEQVRAAGGEGCYYEGDLDGFDEGGGKDRGVLSFGVKMMIRRKIYKYVKGKVFRRKRECPMDQQAYHPQQGYPQDQQAYPPPQQGYPPQHGYPQQQPGYGPPQGYPQV